MDQRTGRVKSVVKTNGEDTEWVSFRTRVTKILVELTWDTGDDFDLYVFKPDGKQPSRFNPETATGRLNGDFTVGCTRSFKSGRETARYLVTSADVQGGTYKIEAHHFDNCGRGPTKWELRIIINGKVVKTKRGRSNGGTDDLVGTTTFNF